MILLLSISVVIVFHAVLFYALLSRRLNALYLVAATFTFMAPVSTASLLEHMALFKYGRVYLSVLIVLLGVLVLRLYRFGPASIAFIAFIGLYFSGALWSQAPLAAILHKGLFGAVFVSGVIIANGTRNIRDLHVGLRILACGGAAFGTFILLELVRNPEAISGVGRLFAFGINPNRIGHTSAPILIVACSVALYDPAKFWRLFGYGLMGVLALVILYTGSRGAVGMAVIGSAVVAVPLVKRPGLFITSAAFVSVIAYIGLGLIADHARTRLGHVPEHLREDVWGMAMTYFREAPVFGQGWVHSQGILPQGAIPSTQNLHSIYFQVLAEIGFVGFFFFLLAMLFVGLKLLGSWRYAIQFPSAKPYAYLMVGFFAAIFAHGFVESATFVGTTVNAVLLGWTIGMIDRLPKLAWQHSQMEALTYEADIEELYDDGHEHALPAY